MVIFLEIAITFIQSCVFVSEAGGGRFCDQPLEPNQLWFILLFSFSCFYVTEVLLKICSLGAEQFWNRHRWQHRFDFINVFALFSVEVGFICINPKPDHSKCSS